MKQKLVGSSKYLEVIPPLAPAFIVACEEHVLRQARAYSLCGTSRAHVFTRQCTS